MTGTDSSHFAPRTPGIPRCMPSLVAPSHSADSPRVGAAAIQRIAADTAATAPTASASTPRTSNPPRRRSAAAGGAAPPSMPTATHAPPRKSFLGQAASLLRFSHRRSAPATAVIPPMPTRPRSAPATQQLQLQPPPPCPLRRREPRSSKKHRERHGDDDRDDESTRIRADCTETERSPDSESDAAAASTSTSDPAAAPTSWSRRLRRSLARRAGKSSGSSSSRSSSRSGSASSPGSDKATPPPPLPASPATPSPLLAACSHHRRPTSRPRSATGSRSRSRSYARSPSSPAASHADVSSSRSSRRARSRIRRGGTPAPHVHEDLHLASSADDESGSECETDGRNGDDGAHSIASDATGLHRRRSRRRKLDRIHSDERDDPLALVQRLRLVWTLSASELLQESYQKSARALVVALYSATLVEPGSAAGGAPASLIGSPASSTNGSAASLDTGASPSPSNAAAAGLAQLRSMLMHSSVPRELLVPPQGTVPGPTVLNRRGSAHRRSRGQSDRLSAEPDVPRPASIQRLYDAVYGDAFEHLITDSPPTASPTATSSPTSPASASRFGSATLPTSPSTPTVADLETQVRLAGGRADDIAAAEAAHTLRVAHMLLTHHLAVACLDAVVRLEPMHLIVVLARPRDALPEILLDCPSPAKVAAMLGVPVRDITGESSPDHAIEDDADEAHPAPAPNSMAAWALEVRHALCAAAVGLMRALVQARLTRPPLAYLYASLLRAVRLAAYVYAVDPSVQWVWSPRDALVSGTSMEIVGGVPPGGDGDGDGGDAIVLFSVCPGLVLVTGSGPAEVNPVASVAAASSASLAPSPSGSAASGSQLAEATAASTAQRGIVLVPEQVFAIRSPLQDLDALAAASPASSTSISPRTSPPKPKPAGHSRKHRSQTQQQQRFRPHHGATAGRPWSNTSSLSASSSSSIATIRVESDGDEPFVPPLPPVPPMPTNAEGPFAYAYAAPPLPEFFAPAPPPSFSSLDAPLILLPPPARARSALAHEMVGLGLEEKGTAAPAP
ncbi:hypothetical protein H9P43_000612 [Blastocladiella emersonii ATCC 22665]|nr:hypothetical protein H9P43_000612 [Blastocladiella emersonii ATCC 22665]